MTSGLQLLLGITDVLESIRNEYVLESDVPRFYDQPAFEKHMHYLFSG